jgi:hypothetical protein
MIPASNPVNTPPVTEGQIAFHVVMDHVNYTFTLDGPDDPNGLRLHFDVQLAARHLQRKFSEFDVRADSKERAVADMAGSFPAYKFCGTWAEAN